MEIALLFLVIITLFIIKTVKVVPQQNAWVVERLGKYYASLTPGLNFVVPFVDKVIQKTQPERNPAGCAQPDLHHTRQHTVAGGWYFVFPGHRPQTGQLRFV